MKLFKTFEKVAEFAVARVIAKPNRLDTTLAVKTQPLKLKNVIPHFVLGYGIFITAMFLFFEAEQFVEFSETFYPFATVVLNLAVISLLIWNGERIFEIIDCMEIIVNKRNFSITQQQSMH